MVPCCQDGFVDIAGVTLADDLEVGEVCGGQQLVEVGRERLLATFRRRLTVVAGGQDVGDDDDDVAADRQSAVRQVSRRLFDHLFPKSLTKAKVTL